MPTTTSRIQSLDVLRGAIMIVMALDHVREFFTSSPIRPEDLTKTTEALFLTRWITHFCAPVFMFAAGAGTFLGGQRKSRAELSRFLWTRGLWLVLLELTVERFAFFFDLIQSPVLLIVLWALGVSMIALAGLIWLPARILAAVSLGVIAFHNLFDSVRAANFGLAAPLWNVLHQPGPIRASGPVVIVGYPLIPWIFVMSAGYCFGRVFLWPSERRRHFLLRLGLVLTAAFIAIRALNIYGDPVSWSPQRTPWFTPISFLNVTKYPPSLDFLLMTLGPAILTLGLLDGIRVRPANPLLIFGRVPLFYFVVHLYIIHAAAALLGSVRYGTGYGLWICYAIWAAVVVALYPLCLWFARLKERRRDWWLSYL